MGPAGSHRGMPEPTDPYRPQTDDEPVAPPRPPTELPHESTPSGDDEEMQRADAANGEPDATDATE
jgi:hypothetical protein